MKINSQEEYEKVMSQITVLSKSEDLGNRSVLVELRNAAQAWDAGRSEAAGDDPKRSGYEGRHNPITAMFDRLNEAENKR